MSKKQYQRQYDKTPSDEMVNVDTLYLRAVIREHNVIMVKLSVELDYCADFLSNSISEGRMSKHVLKILSERYNFPYKSALASSRKKRKK